MVEQHSVLEARSIAYAKWKILPYPLLIQNR